MNGATSIYIVLDVSILEVNNMSIDNQVQEQLVRFFRDEVDVSRLTPSLVDAYVQARDTLSERKDYVSDFERRAKNQGVGTIYDGNGIEIRVVQNEKEEKMAPKERVGSLQTLLMDSVDNNRAGKQMYGVRRFENGSVVAIEADHLLHLMNKAATRILGYTTSIGVNVSEAEEGMLGKIIGQYTPHLQSSTFMPDVSSKTLDNAVVAGTYLASKSQASLLAKRIVNPFEDAFKDKAKDMRRDDSTVCTAYQFGNATVEVMSIPQPKAPWSGILGTVSKRLGEYAGLGSENTGNGFLYFNDDLVKGGKMYVAIPHITEMISDMRNNRTVTHRNEVEVKYNAGPAIIMSA